MACRKPPAARAARAPRYCDSPSKEVQPPNDDRLQKRRGLVGAAEGREQQAELEARRAAGRFPRGGREQRLGLFVPPDAPQQPGAERGGGRVGLAAAGGQRLGRRAVAVREGARGVPVEPLVRGELAGLLTGARAGSRGRRQEEPERRREPREARQERGGGRTRPAARFAGAGRKDHCPPIIARAGRIPAARGQKNARFWWEGMSNRRRHFRHTTTSSTRTM